MMLTILYFGFIGPLFLSNYSCNIFHSDERTRSVFLGSEEDVFFVLLELSKHSVQLVGYFLVFDFPLLHHTCQQIFTRLANIPSGRVDDSWRAACSFHILDDRDQEVAILFFTQGGVSQHVVDDVCELDGVQELMQFEFVVLAVLDLLLVDAELAELAGPKQELNCQQSVLLRASVIPDNPDIYLSFLHQQSLT